MDAALNGQTEVTKLLLEHNADVEDKTPYGKYTNIYTIIKLFNLCILTPLYISRLHQSDVCSSEGIPGNNQIIIRTQC